jgi:hypothetical protein
MILRRLISKKLSEYYSQPANVVVGSMAPVKFSRLWGSWHYMRVYGKLYRRNEGQWLTPVELFKPHYSNTIANFVADQQQRSDSPSLDIFELGGGTGGNCLFILDHLKLKYPEVYERIEKYTIIDESPTLQEKQRSLFAESEHASLVDFRLQSMLDVAEGKIPFAEPSERLTVVITLELLDNLGHDKIRVKHGSKIEQAEVVPAKKDKTRETDSEQELQEVFVPLSDPLLRSIITTAPIYTRTTISWVPTVACGALAQIAKCRPNASILAADFDELPLPDENMAEPIAKPAQGEPIVTDMGDHDHPCYLSAPPLCDILFPTNFSHLTKFCRRVFGKDRVVWVHAGKQSEFLEEYGADEVEATRSWLTGYSPLLHDFSNVSILTVSPIPNDWGSKKEEKEEVA